MSQSVNRRCCAAETVCRGGLGRSQASEYIAHASGEPYGCMRWLLLMGDVLEVNMARNASGSKRARREHPVTTFPTGQLALRDQGGERLT